MFIGGEILSSVEFLNRGFDQVESTGMVQPMVGRQPPLSSLPVLAAIYCIPVVVGFIVYRVKSHRWWGWVVGVMAGIGTFFGMVIVDVMAVMHMVQLLMERLHDNPRRDRLSPVGFR